MEEDVAVRMDGLYRQHRTVLVRLAYLLTGSRDLAEELSQEAFVRLWPRLDEVAEPLAYLRTSVVNLCHGHHRRLATARAHPPIPPGDVLPPEVDEVWTQLWRLPEQQRAALILRYYADLDVAGVAEALGCPLGTAKSHLSRGVARLKEVLEP